MANVDGSWDCVVKSPLGDQKMTLTVNSADTSFSGAVSGAMGGMDVTGEVDGDTMTGTVGAGAFGSFPLSGTRTA